MFRTLEGSKLEVMNETHTYAVITGDVVDSTKTERDYRIILEGIAKDIQRHHDPTFRLEMYRGDSFQALIQNYSKGLFILLLIKAGLRSHSNKQDSRSIENVLDARMSLGIGDVAKHGTAKISLGELDGQAFVRSGRALDNMKGEGLRLSITTGNTTLDDEFRATCPLIDALANRWNIKQAAAIYHYFLTNATQEELGEKLNISQRGAGKRLETSNIGPIEMYNKRFNQLINGY